MPADDTPTSSDFAFADTLWRPAAAVTLPAATPPASEAAGSGF